MACNWADLPWELLDMILQKVIIFPDHIRFSAVCKRWNLAVLEHKQNRTKQMLPVLSIPIDGVNHILYCLEDKVYPYQFPVIPHIEGQFCSGSSQGWLAFDSEDSSITLLKPFSRTTIHIPKLRGESSIYKVILSHDPFLHPDDYTVAVCHYEPYASAAFIKSGEQSWTYLEDHFIVHDICFYKGQLNAVSYSGSLIIVDNSGNVTDLSIDPLVDKENNHFLDWSYKSYLVESYDGDLLLVRRLNLYLNEAQYTDSITDTYEPYYEYEYEFDGGFTVYRLVMKDSSDKGNAEWVEIESLGDSVLFLGPMLQAVCISASSAPNCKKNRIYYTADSAERNKSFGVYSFDLNSKQIEECFEIPSFSCERGSSFWIFPTLF